MTRTEACRTLGINSSVRTAKAKLLYNEKCKELRLQMVPGMPQATRQKAQAELAKVSSAWQIIQQTPCSAPNKAKRKPRRNRRSSTRQTPHRPIWPQASGQPVADFVGRMPLPKTLVTIIYILSMLIVITMIRSCVNTCVNTFTKSGTQVSSCVNFVNVTVPATGKSTTNTQAIPVEHRPEPLNAQIEDIKPRAIEQKPFQDIEVLQLKNTIGKIIWLDKDNKPQRTNTNTVQIYQREI